MAKPGDRCDVRGRRALRPEVVEGWWQPRLWGSHGEIEGLGHSQLGGILCYGSEVVLGEGEVGLGGGST